MEQEIRWLLEEKYKGKLTPQAKKDIAKLKKGEHVDYLIGWKPFLNCAIDLRYKPLIPRVETEYWAEKAVQDVSTANFPGALPHPAGWGPTRLRKIRSASIACLDMFAGSGCIGITVLKNVPYAHVDFADNNRKFLRQVQLNARINSIAKRRYSVILSDIFSGIRGKYDYIFANPPYLAESKRKKVQKSVLEQEPHGALFGGKDGLKYISLFLRQSKEFLAKKGVIYLEFDSFQKREIEELLKKFCYYC